MTIGLIKQELRQYTNPRRAVDAPRYFKTGAGEYAEGDKFIGVTVPDTRKVAKKYKETPRSQLVELLHSPWHEERLVALFILVDQFKRGDDEIRKEIYDLYIKNTEGINNWDLVDSSASYIVGGYLANRPERIEVLERLARSDSLWERRIAMISTLYFIVILGRADETLLLADILLHDKHDLIQKAVGWMLREVGKRVDIALLAEYLDRNAATMPRTTLRYAIEHFSPDRRAYYLYKADTTHK